MISRARSAFRGSILFTFFLATVGGCNAILGNKEGSTLADSTLDAAGDEEDPTTTLPDTAPAETAPRDASTLEEDAEPAASCEPSKKLCEGSCVSKTDAVFGCAGTSCAPCALRHATSVCSGTGCAVGACDPGYADCDQDPSNGCETDLSQPEHCGTCNAVCGATAPYCSQQAGSFTCTSGCSGGATLCGNQCADITVSPTHCGSCSNSCSAVQNGVVRCEGGACKFDCKPGFHACGAGCAKDADVATCGAACSPCIPPANGTATCNGVSCGFKCKGGYHACGNQCVKSSDVASCGGSCTPCTAPPNGTATCNGTACGFTCAPGFHACGPACASDDDVATCGGACSPCPTGPNASATCAAGACGLACTAGYGDCDKNAATGCEAVFATDPANCGACGVACAESQRCEVGVCVSE